MDDAAAKEALWGSDESLRGMYSTALRDNLGRLRDATEMTEADVNSHLLDMAKFGNDAGIPPQEMTGLHGLIVHHVEKPANDATVQQWALEARRGLRERYGEDGLARAAEASKYLKENHPALQDYLNRTGVGSHPRVVLQLAEKITHIRARKK